MDFWKEYGLGTPEPRQPDFNRFIKAVTTNEPGPVPVGDLFADAKTMTALLGKEAVSIVSLRSKLSQNPDKSPDGLVSEGMKFLALSVEFYQSVGWDFVTSHAMLGFPGFKFLTAEKRSKEIQGGRRAYIESDNGPLMSWEDFENYEWPESPGVINLPAKILATMIPDGMKILALPGGLFEWTTWLMGLVPFSYAIYDQPDLVGAIINKLSEIIYTGARELLAIPQVGGIFIGDDMGFFSGTLVSPDILRQKFLPHLKKMVDLAHENNKLALLHSCGNLTAIMDDLVETGIDGKHSFEDKIMHVEEAHKRWGDRIGLIGGLDLDLLSSGAEDDIRKRTRQILDACGPKGHYVLGTGNSIASYIPIKNYLVMIDEGRKWNQNNFGREF